MITDFGVFVILTTIVVKWWWKRSEKTKIESDFDLYKERGQLYQKSNKAEKKRQETDELIAVILPTINNGRK